MEYERIKPKKIESGRPSALSLLDGNCLLGPDTKIPLKVCEMIRERVRMDEFPCTESRELFKFLHRLFCVDLPLEFSTRDIVTHAVSLAANQDFLDSLPESPTSPDKRKQLSQFIESIGDVSNLEPSLELRMERRHIAFFKRAEIDCFRSALFSQSLTDIWFQHLYMKLPRPVSLKELKTLPRCSHGQMKWPKPSGPLL